MGKIFNIRYPIFFTLPFVLCSLFFVVVPAFAKTEKPADIEPLTNPLGEQTVPSLIGSAIGAVLSVVGSLALIMFIYGGIKWMTAAGNSEQVKSAGQIMLWAGLGLAVIFSSYIILKFIFEAVG